MPEPTAVPRFVTDTDDARIQKLLDDRLTHLFFYHPPTPDQIPKYEAIRAGAKAFAKIVLENTPGCADQSAALRHVRDAAMTANAAIALGGRS